MTRTKMRMARDAAKKAADANAREKEEQKNTKKSNLIFFSIQASIWGGIIFLLTVQYFF